MSQCCLFGSKWDGTPVGNKFKLGNNDTYVTGSNQDVPIMIVHDVYSWTFPDSRFLADHYTQEADATVWEKTKY